MKKIFSLPLISKNLKKSEFYSVNNSYEIDYYNSSVDLTDEKRIKLEQLQSKLDSLINELDIVMDEEAKLVKLSYNKKNKSEPFSIFNSPIERLNGIKGSNSSLSKDFILNDKLNKSDQNPNKTIVKENKDQLDFSNTNNIDDVKDISSSKFYYPLGELNLNKENKLDINSNQLNKDNFESINESVTNQDDLIKKSIKKNNKINKSSTLNQSRLLNSPINEQDENINYNLVSIKKTNNNQIKNRDESNNELLNKKIKILKQKFKTIKIENTELKTNLNKTIQNENDLKLNCKELEDKLLDQKEKIDKLNSRLTESLSNYNKLKVEHQKFKSEIEIEREKYINIKEELKNEQVNIKKQLENRLKDKDDLIKNLLNEIDNLKSNLKNKNLTIDLIERNKLISSQKINLDQKIESISIYQKNNIPELVMINLDDKPLRDSTILYSKTSNNENKSIDDSTTKLNNSTRSLIKLNNQNKIQIKGNKNDKQSNDLNQSNNSQNTIILNKSIKNFCTQINQLQKEFSLIADENDKRDFMIKIEDFVLKNMRKLVVDKMDSFFDTLQLYLATLKFEIIQFAIENEQKRHQYYFKHLNYDNNRKSTSSLEWFKLIANNLTTLNKKQQQQSKNQFIDLNHNLYNQQQFLNIRNHNLRDNNIQNRTVERRMIELKKSMETYLKSYLVRILLEMQEQSN